MVSEFGNLISFKDLYSTSTDNFLNPFQEVIKPDIHNGMKLTFELHEKEREQKISPILILAKVQDAPAIVDIYKDIYGDTYPYKEMLSIEAIRNMISDSNYRWLLFKAPQGEITGCFTFELDFEKKRGYMRGFNIKRRFQGTIDAVKAVIGSMIEIWNEYYNEILLWYCENRTAHTKSQYLSIVCGIHPIALLPNKDIFFDKVESDVLHVAYSSRALGSYRSKEIPYIISEVEKCYQYSNQRYRLGTYNIEHSEVSLNQHLVDSLTRQIGISIKRDNFKYETIHLELNNGSYVEFLFTPEVYNFEKISFQTKRLEEFYVLMVHLKNIIKKWSIRYCEIYISAYEPSQQKILLDLGFKPRGYFPSWEIVDGKLEDRILFNIFSGGLTEQLNLLDQSKELLNFL